MRFADLRRMVSQWWAGILTQTRLSRVGEGTSTLDSVRMTDPTEDGPGAEIDVTRLEGFGDVVCPPTDIDTIVLTKSDGAISFALGQTSTRPTDAKQGDRGLYSATAGTRIHLCGPRSSTPGRIFITNASGAKVEVLASGDIVLTDKDGGTATLSGSTLTVEDTVDATSTLRAGEVTESPHFAGRGNAPTALAGAGVGGGSVTLLSGASDAAFTLECVVNMGAPDVLATVTFAEDYGSIPRDVHYGVLSANGATPPAAGSFWLNPAANQIEIATTTTLTDGTYILSIGIVR